MRNTNAIRRYSCSSRRPDSRHIPAAWFLLLALASANAGAEIYRCPQADGTVSFQETPCPEPVANEETGSQGEQQPEDPATADALQAPVDDTFSSPFDDTDEPVISTEPVEPALPLPSDDRAECEKLTRDAIDAIDLELQKGYSEEEREAYADELLLLTKQLRACKSL